MKTLQRASYNLISFALITSFMIVGCKKDDGDGQDTGKMYLAKTFTDGKLSTEYIYGAGETLPSRSNTYDTSGNIQSYRTMKYSNGKFTEIHYYGNTGLSIGMYKYYYNAYNLLSTSLYYRTDTSTTVYTIGQYYYNSDHVCTMYKYLGADSTLKWLEKYGFTGKNNTKTEYYNSNDELKATVVGEYDNMNFPYSDLTALGTIKQVNNLIERTSPDADANGKLSIYLGNSTLTIPLSHSEFEYNSLNYPIKETKTLTANPNVVHVYTYQYKE
ncbi:MAG: hypothetical protein ACOYN4_14040 [Bacteroidales bacterium]